MKYMKLSTAASNYEMILNLNILPYVHLIVLVGILQMISASTVKFQDSITGIKKNIFSLEILMQSLEIN